MGDATTILAAAQALGPRIRGLAPTIRTERRLPRGLVDELKAAGVFRMAMPVAWGGPELSMLEQLAVFEELSYADGSVGWCAMIGADSGFYSAFLDEGVARELYPDLDMVTAGLAQPAAPAVRDGAGWRVTGKWAFGSGCTHADRMVGGCFLQEADGTVLVDAIGLPQWRTLFLPMDAVEILDTWHTTGLEGSGSNDYAVTDAWVPEEHGVYVLGPTQRSGPLYALPWWFIVKVAAVPLGIGRRALDELAALAGSKLSVPEFTLLGEQPRLQAALARATALVGSARAYLTDVVGSAWDTLAAGHELSGQQLGLLRLAMLNASGASREAVTICYDAAATTAIFRSNPFDQLLRDVSTIAQHIVLQSKSYEPVGRRLLGMEPKSFMV